MLPLKNGREAPLDVTVAILTYDRGSMVSRALRSVFNSHMPHHSFEVVVVDDGSKDDTQEFLKPYLNKVITIRNSSNLGVGKSSQIALESSRGEFFVRVDSDDFVSSDFLHTMLLPLKFNENLDLITCDHLLVNDLEEPRGVENLFADSSYVDFGAGMLFRKSRLMEVGGYDPTLRYGEDLDLHLRLQKIHAKRYHFPVPLYRRRIHPNNMYNTSLDQIQRRKIREKHAEF